MSQLRMSTLSLVAASLLVMTGCAAGQSQEIDDETQAAAEEFIYGTVGEYSKERSDAALARWTFKEDEFSGLQVYDPPFQDRDFIGGERASSGEVEVYPRVAVSDGEVFLVWSVSYRGYGWMFLDEMLVRVDEETISFPIEPSYDISRDTLGNGSQVLEASMTVFPNFQLGDYGKLADASSARLRVSGSDETLDRDFTVTEMKLIREARDIYLALTQE